MAEFSMQDAAFTGFRVVREHPKALAFWALAALAASLVFGTVFVSMAGPALTTLQAINSQPSRDPTQVLALFGQLAPAYGLFFGAAIAFNSFLYAAMNRAVFRPTDDRFGYFRAGADELRQFGLQLLAFVMFVGVYLVLMVVMVLLAILFALASKAAAGIGVALGVAAVLCALVFLAVRFSLASALTFDGGRVNLFGSWTLTRGRFWPLFGTYLLAFALAVVVYMLSLLVIFAAAAMVSGGNPMTTMFNADMTSLAAYFSPTRIVQMVLGAGVSALIWPLMLTPAAAIYRCLVPAAAAGAPV